MAQLTRAEQETTIRWDAEEGVAHIFSATPATIRKLDEQVQKYPDTFRCVRVDEKNKSKWYEVPIGLIRFANPPSEAKRATGKRLGAMQRAKAAAST